ncbi:MAG: glutamate-1-semialdehyde 2,1-aminomutase [Armatimonadota bacterium]|nr:MAG: glutamate-1-semialdehyde 2,1-aminomutase [Armatimonadota bacterium]
MIHEKSYQLYTKAQQWMPAGVNSPVRAFRAVGGTPFYVQSAKGALLTDVDGNRYIDYVCSWGALILGHSHPSVVKAIKEAAAKGTSYGTPHEGEILLAEQITRAMPWIEMLRFVNSGTEAAISAIRLARAATGRSKILKFEGNYHGHADHLLAKAGSGVATFALPDSAGVPAEMTQHTLVAPYNRAEAVEALFREAGEQIAAVIVEPVAGNMGVVPPAPGFLQLLRDLTSRYRSLLIFDEVITGFRVSRQGAAGLYGIVPDLVCLGKIIGGGLPVGAYGGKRELMQMVAPLGPVYQAGTLSGNPLAMAAGLATLRELHEETYAQLEQRASFLQQAVAESTNKLGVPAQVNRVGSMLNVFFTEHPVTDSASAFTTDRQLYARLFHALLKRGVFLPPSALEAWFVSTAHTESYIERTARAFHAALKEALAA